MAASTARKPQQRDNKATAAAAKKPAAKPPVAVARKSEPIIQMVGRAVPAKATPDLPKKAGQLPTPIASFVF